MVVEEVAEEVEVMAVTAVVNSLAEEAYRNKMEAANIWAEAAAEAEAANIWAEVTEATDEGVAAEDSIWPPVRYCHHWKNLLK